MRDDNFISIFSSIRKKLYKLLNEQIKKYDLSIIEATYLIIINSSKEGISFKELTKEADCDKGLTSRLISHLKSKGLIIEEDKFYRVTNEGKVTAIKVRNILNNYKSNLDKKIPKRELEDFYKKLQLYNNILEEEIKCLN